jgi:hypothetical protein
MILIRRRTAILLTLLLLAIGSIAWWWERDSFNRAFGNFVGKVAVTWDDDGRNMTLERDFTYIDPHGKPWLAPTGAVINGASIPRLFWSAIGGPFEGKFRNASVIHDTACEAQKEPWEDVHRMFYNAMRCSRVGEGQAQTMYWAVYHFGPRWRQMASQQTINGETTTITRTITEVRESPPEEIVAKAERYFNRKQFTPEEIEDCSVEDIENEVAKWDAAKKSP